VFKKYLREWGRKDLTSEPGEETPDDTAERLYFGWKQEVRKYRKIR
jgi:hypothetical protein